MPAADAPQTVADAAAERCLHVCDDCMIALSAYTFEEPNDCIGCGRQLRELSARDGREGGHG